MTKNLYPFQIRFPDLTEDISQDEEWVELDFGDQQETIRFHDYHRIYEIEGLYERLFQQALGCCSPEVLSDMLAQCLQEEDEDAGSIRILDFGAGNGMVGEALKMKIQPEHLVGVDILPEARMAAYRDRPAVYNDYWVMDLAAPDEDQRYLLEHQGFNALVTVAALGFDDIPPEGFIRAFNLISPGGWVAFNIKDAFVSESDESGYQEIIYWMGREHLEIKARKRYCHRRSVDGRPLHYLAFVGKKRRDIRPV